MNSISFLVLFILFVMIFTIIIEVFTILFRMTGVSAEKARTQIISLLTNCGFTTEESELALSTHRRRKLTQMTIICGYCFSMIIVSLLVNFFLRLNQAEVRELVLPVIGLLLLMVVLIAIMRLNPIRSWFDKCIERIGTRMMYGRNTNAITLIDTYYSKSVVEVVLESVPPSLENTPLCKSGLKQDWKIQILSITHQGVSIEPITGDTILNVGDSLVLFGDYKTICNIFGQNQ